MTKNRPNSQKYTYQHLPLEVTPKFTQSRIFGLKISHLATLGSWGAWPAEDNDAGMCHQVAADSDRLCRRRDTR
jgi:hypothetical protein